MAFEKILEFGEGNRYKVKFEVGNKVITAEEEMVSAWNKYIGLKMEGQE